ncbi:MAG: hypothetical protein WKF77_14715 [Planctomycetaceae bacterium]
MQCIRNPESNRFCVLMLWIPVMIGGSSANAAADEANMLPGLHCVVSDGQLSVTRIDRRLSFDWTDSRIDSRVNDVQSVIWSGSLLVRTPERHTFHAQVSGSV